MLNLSTEQQSFNVSDQKGQGQLLLSTRLEREHEGVHGRIDVQGNEGMIISL